MTSFADLEAMRVGARNAVRVCMKVSETDRVAVIGDVASQPIARLLAEEACNISRQVETFLLESFGPRPIKALPEALRLALLTLRPTVTFFTASSEPGEITFRIGLRVFLLRDLNVRHGHMVGITPQVMREGMAVDYQRVAMVTTAVYERARLAEEIRVTSPEGTDLVARFHPGLRWVSSSGLYHRQGQWGNLPGGETFSSPIFVEGTFSARVVGDHFSRSHGLLREPLVVTIRDSHLVDVTGPKSLARDFLAYVRGAENGRRVGEFAIGTNVGLRRLIGNMLQDEKYPGAHIAFGDPYPDETGAQWSSPVHVDLVTTRATITIDGEVIMRDGRFDLDRLQPEPEGKPST